MYMRISWDWRHWVNSESYLFASCLNNLLVFHRQLYSFNGRNYLLANYVFIFDEVLNNEMTTIKIKAFWDFQGYGRIYRESFITKYAFFQLYSPVSLILYMLKWWKIRSNDAKISNFVTGLFICILPLFIYHQLTYIYSFIYFIICLIFLHSAAFYLYWNLIYFFQSVNMPSFYIYM